MGAEKQTNIHTCMHTHTFWKTISVNQAPAWIKNTNILAYMQTHALFEK